MIQPLDTPSTPKPVRVVLKAGWRDLRWLFLAVPLWFTVRHLVSMLHEHDVSKVISLAVFWGICVLATLVIFVREAAGNMIVQKADGLLTVNASIGPIPLWRIRTVCWTDMKDLLVREHVYKVKGHDCYSYEILYEDARDTRVQWELLGGLSLENVEQLLKSVLHDVPWREDGHFTLSPRTDR